MKNALFRLTYFIITDCHLIDSQKVACFSWFLEYFTIRIKYECRCNLVPNLKRAEVFYHCNFESFTKLRPLEFKNIIFSLYIRNSCGFLTSFILTIHILGALAAGNAVILKPSELSPAASNMMAKVLPKYLDRECVQVFLGGVQETTDLLKERFDYIFFTGSTTVGRIVYQAAVKHLTPTTLELGMKDVLNNYSPCDLII